MDAEHSDAFIPNSSSCGRFVVVFSSRCAAPRFRVHHGLVYTAAYCGGKLRLLCRLSVIWVNDYSDLHDCLLSVELTYKLTWV